MRVTNITSRTVKTYWVAIADGDIRDLPYSRVGRRYCVQRMVVTKRDGNVDGVELHGSVLKKDGSVGLSPASEHLYRQSEWPEWVRSIAGGLA